MMIIPAVFAFSGGDESALSAGPGLMFITLPKVFESIPGGRYLGILFFVLVLFAALTSSISLMETVVSILQDKLKIGRKLACLIVFLGSFLLGLLSALGYGSLGHIKLLGMQFLDFFDFISNSVLMPITALLTCIFVGYIVKPKIIAEEVELSGRFRWQRMFDVMIKYVAPIFMLVILISSVLSAFQIITI